MIDIKIQEVFDYFYSPEIRWRDAIWRGTTLKGIQYYYAEEGLYIFRISYGYHYAYVFVYAKSPIEAAQFFMKKTAQKTAMCEYCGKPYHKKKKAQRFCCIKCKDKWWNRERFSDTVYLHPQCEDNFNGDW